MQDELSEIDLLANACCIWQRFVVDNNARSIRFTREFIHHLVSMSDTLGFRHALVLSSLRNARLYRACHTALGVTFEIQKYVPEYAKGEFTGLEHYLSVSHLRKPVKFQLVA